MHPGEVTILLTPKTQTEKPSATLLETMQFDFSIDTMQMHTTCSTQRPHVSNKDGI